MKKRTKLKKFSSSPKKQEARKEYKIKRAEYLQKHRYCECGCDELSQDIHHKAGRGIFLNRIDTWMAVARKCHDFIHANPEESYAKGYLINATALASQENNE